MLSTQWNQLASAHKILKHHAIAYRSTASQLSQ